MSITTKECIAIVVFSLLASLAIDCRGQEATTRLRFDKDEGLIVFPVNVFNKQFSCVFDTGSTGHVIDSSLRDLFDEPYRTVNVVSGQSRVPVELFRPIPLQIGDFRCKSNRGMFVMNLREMREITGHDIKGIVGMSLADDATVTIDNDRGIFCISPHNQEEESSSSNGRRIRAISHDRSPVVRCVECEIDGTTWPFLLDTGCNSTGTMEGELFDKLVGEELLTIITHDDEYLAFDTIHEAPVARLNCVLGLGPFQHKNLIFTKSDSNKLGMGYWRRYARMRISVHDRSIYLIKGKEFNVQDEYYKYEIGIRRVNDKIIIDRVSKDSHSEKAGLKTGVEIVKVKGEMVRELSIARILRALRGPEPIDIVVRMANGDTNRISVNCLAENVAR